MNERLYLAGNLVPGTLVYGHLQIVYEDANGNLLETETTSPGFPFFFGDWVYTDFGRAHDVPQHTPGYGSPDNYAIVGLNLRTEQTSGYVWELLGQIFDALRSGGFGLDYEVQQNSNSYVKTALSVVGVDVTEYLTLATPDSVSSFPGVETNILDGAKTDGLLSGYDTAIPLTLAGTDGNDIIVTGIGADSLRGGAGNDTIRSGSGKDRVWGGDGHDLLFGNAGADVLNGGAGDDQLTGGSGGDRLTGSEGNDTLSGGKGKDTLKGGVGNDIFKGGRGSDKQFGGDGADTFVFNKNAGKDTIVDFEDGDLIRITSGAERFADLDFSELQEGLLVEFGAVDILLEGLARSDIDQSDFAFV